MNLKLNACPEFTNAKIEAYDMFGSWETEKKIQESKRNVLVIDARIKA